MKTYKIKTAQVVVQQGKGVGTNAQHSAFAVLFESLDSAWAVVVDNAVA